MRLVRLGTEVSGVGADLRGVLAACGAGDGVLGGVAVLGCTPRGCDRRLDAVLVHPRGILVVVGVDLPDPALKLSAPLHGTWRVDGWELVRPDGVLNPASEALAATNAVAQLLQDAGAEPLPVSTVVAVGPYVEKVVQPTADLLRGLRVLHPTAPSLMAAARELATADHPCNVEEVQHILNILGAPADAVRVAELTAEGFPDCVSPTLATASTLMIPRVAELPVPTPTPGTGRVVPRWMPVTMLGAAGVLLAAVLVFAVTTARGENQQQNAAATPTANESTVDGVRFVRHSSVRDDECAGHAYGDVQVWLAGNRCVGMVRGLLEATGPAGRAGVSVAVLGFANATAAEEFRKVLAVPGGGGIVDLVREGYGWPAGPRSFSDAAFVVTRDGEHVRVAQAVWLADSSSPDDASLRWVAERALRVPLPG
ncbi:hypothetical protein GCM10012275_35390 [Longimycelium tulufanense]|uniref:Uncharacterized protein n=1 Tax=Longimycelium tulufanense TaxID=907463 RepID=A0A8J3FUR8_9PSEU|nr:hypothetical protein [Longimycelium tulufanense]GGM61297.1 hypothetical protein GCM10012275_35390 [Longimycelium tulufanense]